MGVLRSEGAALLLCCCGAERASVGETEASKSLYAG
jgi:hypothetical protein